jgi:hypothetical protein
MSPGLSAILRDSTWFSSVFQDNAVTVPKTRPRPFSSTFFHIQYLLNHIITGGHIVCDGDSIVK